MLKRGVIRVVGFDLDGTLYKEDERINDRIRDEIAREMVAYNPSFGSAETARAFFEKNYAVLGSGRKVLAEIGIKDASVLIDECIARVDILDMIPRDEKLIELMDKLKNNYEFGLVTSNTEAMASRKLKRLGLDKRLFKVGIFRDGGMFHKDDGTAFLEYLNRFRLPASAHVYVGNSLKADILPARNLGIRTVAVWSYIQEADISIPNIYELENIL